MKIKLESTIFLKLAIFFIGLVVLALCIFALPSAWSGIGREYPDYPGIIRIFRIIIIGMYVSAVPFYLGLYQGIKLLSFIDKNTAFSDLSVKALRTIKYCALLISVIYIGGVPLLYPFAEFDDAPGVLPIGLAIALAPFVVSVFAAVLEKLVQNAIDIKTENDLTV